MRFFPKELPLSVIHHIASDLDEKTKRNLSMVNQAWRAYPFEEQNYKVESEEDVPVEKLLPHLVKFLPRKVESIEIKRFTAGCSPWAVSYEVAVGPEKFVLRQINYGTGQNNEVIASLYFSEMGVAPKVEYFDYDAGIFIMRFVDNDAKHLRGLSNNQLDDIASKLNLIHQGPQLLRREGVERSTLISDRRKQLEHMIEMYPEFYILSYTLQQLDRLAKFTKSDALCHNDINPNNMLAQENNIQFIDWECVGLNDSFLDLATIAATLRLNEEQSLYLLTQYLKEEPNEKQLFHYQRMIQLALLRFAISFAANVKDPEAVRFIDIKSIPSFSQYDPERHGAVNKSTDGGRYYISIMLIKQAMLRVSDYQFNQALAIERPQISRLHYLPIPAVVWHQVLTILDKTELSKLKLVNHAWKNLVDAHTGSGKRIEKESVLELAKSESIGTRLWESLSGFNPSLVGEIQPLQGGLSPFCQNFLLDTGSHKFVIKVMVNGSVGFVPEALVNCLASKHGIGPVVDGLDVSNQVQYTEFVANDFVWLRGRTASHLAELASVLKSLHTIPTPNSKSFFFESKFDVMVKTVQRQIAKTPHQEIFKHAVVLLKQLEPVLGSDIKQALCHFDVNPWNLLYRSEFSQFKLIDWELSRVGHPFIDVATIANFLRLNPIEEGFLFMAYCNQEVTKQDEARYQIAKLYCYLRYAICSLAINGDESYAIDTDIIKILPTFDQFNPRELKIDKDTAEGRYYIAMMFLKAAVKLLRENDYVSSLDTYRSIDTKAMETLRVPLIEEKVNDETLTTQYFSSL